jgi:hypothetical protein
MNILPNTESESGKKDRIEQKESRVKNYEVQRRYGN